MCTSRFTAAPCPRPRAAEHLPAPAAYSVAPELRAWEALAAADPAAAADAIAALPDEQAQALHAALGAAARAQARGGGDDEMDEASLLAARNAHRASRARRSAE